MTISNFRLAAYDFDRPEGLSWGPEASCFAFSSDSELTITERGNATLLAMGDGRWLPPNSVLYGRGWLFAATHIETPLLPASVANLELAADLRLDSEASYILRADAVTSASGAKTPRHGHRGPGIRRLQKGLLLAEVGECTKRIRPGDAWFESGSEWVVGSNISASDNTFIRVMMLPADLRGGQSSFVPASAEDAAKPRAAQYHLFGEIDFSSRI